MGLKFVWFVDINVKLVFLAQLNAPNVGLVILEN